jgi:hypothetical protein
MTVEQSHFEQFTPTHLRYIIFSSDYDGDTEKDKEICILTVQSGSVLNI